MTTIDMAAIRDDAVVNGPEDFYWDAVAGTLSFDIEIVVSPHEPDQMLIVYTAEPGSPTTRLLPILASWDVDAAPSVIPKCR